jgi:hypothetical protein
VEPNKPDTPGVEASLDIECIFAWCGGGVWICVDLVVWELVSVMVCYREREGSKGRVKEEKEIGARWWGLTNLTVLV